MFRKLCQTRALALAALLTLLLLVPPCASASLTATAGWRVSDFVTGFPGVSAVGPIGLSFDPSGAWFYAGDFNDGSMYRFGGLGGAAGPLTRLASTPLSGNPAGLAFTADGRLYLARTTAGDVVELSPSSGAVLRTLASGFTEPRALAVDPVSGDLFFTSAYRPLERISRPASASPVLSAYAPLTNPDGMVFGPDGTAYAVDIQAATVNIVRIAATNSATPGAAAVIAQVPTADGIAVGANPNDHAKPPFLAVNRTDGAITLIDLSTLAQSPIATGGSRGDFASVGPDGCLYATQSDRIVKVAATDGSCPFGHRFEPGPFLPPTAATGAATQATLASVTLTGLLNPHGVDTTVHFDYGPTSTYGASTASVDSGAGAVETATQVGVSNFVPCATYHYQLVAQSRAGVNNGGDKTFQASCPPPSLATTPPSDQPPPPAGSPIPLRPCSPVHRHRSSRQTVGRTGRLSPPRHTHSGPRGRSRPPARPVLVSPRTDARVQAGIVRFRWRSAARAARYILMVDHHKVNAGCRNKMALRVAPGHHKWRVIAQNRRGTKSSHARAFAAISPPSIDEIRRGLGLDVLDANVVAAAERITLRAAESAAFRSALRSLGKFATRASLLGFLVSLGLENGDLNCEQGPLYMAAKPVFIEAADVLARAARARVGSHPAIVAKLADVRDRINKLRTFIAQNRVVAECSGPNKVALATINKLDPTLAAAGARLAGESHKQPPTKRECVTTPKLLRGFRGYVDRFSPGTSRKRLEELQRLLDQGKLRPEDSPGKVQRRIPPRFFGKTIHQIEEECRNAR